jgi:hypothetical protein
VLGKCGSHSLESRKAGSRTVGDCKRWLQHGWNPKRFGLLCRGISVNWKFFWVISACRAVGEQNRLNCRPRKPLNQDTSTCPCIKTLSWHVVQEPGELPSSSSDLTLSILVRYIKRIRFKVFVILFDGCRNHFYLLYYTKTTGIIAIRTHPHMLCSVLEGKLACCTSFSCSLHMILWDLSPTLICVAVVVSGIRTRRYRMLVRSVTRRAVWLCNARFWLAIERDVFRDEEICRGVEGQL